MKRNLLLILSLCMTVLFGAALAHGQAPKCLFSNIQYGPATGGEGGNGTYLIIYGHFFGSTPTVTVNGVAPAQYIVRGSGNSPGGNLDMIGIQVASTTTGTGNIVVTTGSGSCGVSTGNGSFPLPFTVTTGHHIYFIGSAVDNTALSCPTALSTNSFASPWGMASTSGSRNPYSYYNCIANGDTLVFLNGAVYPYSDGRGWSASMTIDKSGGTGTNFVNIMGRPGATVVIGGQQLYGMRGTGAGGFTHYSNLVAIGKSDDGMGMNNNDVIIGNTIECPTCGGEAGALDGSSGGGQGQLILGNWITNVSLPGPSNKQYHDLYMSGNNWEVGWNKISGGSAYNGIQINEDTTPGWHNFSVHDNEISGANGSCITFVTVNPNAGYVEGFNNVLHDCGVQQASDGSSDTPHNGMSSKASATSTATGSIEWWNNTVFNPSVELNTSSSCGGECGAYQIASGQTGLNVDLRNNANYLPAYAHAGTVNCFFADDSSPGPFTGIANLFWSVTTCGSTTGVSTVGSLTNYLPTTPSEGPWQNFIPQSSSPANGTGAVLPANVHVLGQFIPLTWDFAGNTVNPSAPQIGALAFSGSAPVFTISTSTVGNGTISGCPVTVTAGTPYSCLAMAGVGSSFALFTTTPAAGGTTTSTTYHGNMPSFNFALQATFTLNSYLLTCSAATGGSLTGSTCNTNYNYGSSYSFTATPLPGYSFVSLVSSPSCGGILIVNVYAGDMPAAPCTLTPTFAPSAPAAPTALTGIL